MITPFLPLSDLLSDALKDATPKANSKQFHPLKNYPMVSLPLCLKKVKGMCDGGQPEFPAIPDLRGSGNRDVFEELS
jgi:hypothetical protein